MESGTMRSVDRGRGLRPLHAPPASLRFGRGEWCSLRSRLSIRYALIKSQNKHRPFGWCFIWLLITGFATVARPRHYRLQSLGFGWGLNACWRNSPLRYEIRQQALSGRVCHNARYLALCQTLPFRPQPPQAPLARWLGLRSLPARYARGLAARGDGAAARNGVRPSLNPRSCSGSMRDEPRSSLLAVFEIT